MRGRPILRLAVAAFLADMALYLVMTGVPYRALAFGAGAFALGLLPAARGIPYSISTMWAGAFTERGDRLRAARITLIVAVLAVIAFIFVRGLPGIFVLLVLLGFAFAFYWPAIQAALADLGAQGITRSIGWFNMSWSAGKATGFALGGALLAGFGFPVLFLVAAIAILGVLVLIAFPLPKPADQADAVLLSGLQRAPREVRAFRHASWVANAIAYGIASVLNLHYPHWLRQIGHGEVLLGTYLGLVFGSQTLSFFLLTRFPGWRHRVAPLLLLQAPMVLALAVLPFLRVPWAILATAPLVGLGLGIAYFASLFYSVEAPRDRGRNAGAHESVLTIGSVIVPVLAGLLATATHHLETPYFLAAAVGGAGLGAQGLLLRGRTG
jgi:MFS family permease